MMMRLTILATAILIATAPFSSFAQQLFRDEAVPYLIREDAKQEHIKSQIERRTKSDNIIPFAVGEITQEGTGTLFTPPPFWIEGHTILHLEQVGYSYQLEVNDTIVATVLDNITPSDFDISKYIQAGVNKVAIINTKGNDELSKANIEQTQALANSYFYHLQECDIVDFEATIRPDKSGLYAHLDIYVEIANSRNYAETLDVGFDIYDPAGKLLDYSFRDVEVNGKSSTTTHFHSYIYDAEQFAWSPNNPALYSVTVLTRQSGVVTSYRPRAVAYLERTYSDGGLYNFGKRESLKSTTYNANSSITETLQEIKELKTKGFNTIKVSYPQPKWFYGICDSEGLYVVEQANIDAPQEATNRAIGGTPSNNPKHLAEYLRRTSQSYSRTKSHPSVIAFSLGNNSGNGYNMYKSYQQLKELEGESGRPIIYSGAGDEWNSDKLDVQ